jgi:hypothetical protein
MTETTAPLRPHPQSCLDRAAYWERIAAEERARLTREYPQLTVLQIARVHEAARHCAALAEGRARSERRAWVDTVLANAADYLATDARANLHTAINDYGTADTEEADRLAVRALGDLAAEVAAVNAYVVAKL